MNRIVPVFTIAFILGFTPTNAMNETNFLIDDDVQQAEKKRKIASLHDLNNGAYASTSDLQDGSDSNLEEQADSKETNSPVLATDTKREASELGRELLKVVASRSLNEINDRIAQGAEIKVPDAQGDTLLHNASRKGDLALVLLLLEKGADISTKNLLGETPLHCAATSGSHEVVSVLISKNAHVLATDNEGLTALHYAALRGYKSVSELLFSCDKETNRKSTLNWTPLHCAAHNGHWKVCEFLLKNGAQVNLQTNDGCTPLYLAVVGDNGPAVKILLKHNADVSLYTTTKRTPLHAAAEISSMNLVRLLVAKGASVNALDSNNYTPLHVAAEKTDPYIVEHLVYKKALVAARTLKGWTPLHFAAQDGKERICKLLLTYGADVNATSTDNGYSALYLAVHHDHLDVTKLLLKHGANKELMTSDGWTPLKMARKQKFYNQVMILEDASYSVKQSPAKRVSPSSGIEFPGSAPVETSNGSSSKEKPVQQGKPASKSSSKKRPASNKADQQPTRISPSLQLLYDATLLLNESSESNHPVPASPVLSDPQLSRGNDVTRASTATHRFPVDEQQKKSITPNLASVFPATPVIVPNSGMLADNRPLSSAAVSDTNSKVASSTAEAKNGGFDVVFWKLHRAVCSGNVQQVSELLLKKQLSKAQRFMIVSKAFNQKNVELIGLFVSQNIITLEELPGLFKQKHSAKKN